MASSVLAPMAIFHMAVRVARLAASIFLALAPAMSARERAVKCLLDASALQNARHQPEMVGALLRRIVEGREACRLCMLRAMLVRKSASLYLAWEVPKVMRKACLALHSRHFQSLDSWVEAPVSEA